MGIKSMGKNQVKVEAQKRVGKRWGLNTGLESPVNRQAGKPALQG